MMRYHWGLGVGHLYAHQPTSKFRCESESQEEILVDLERDGVLGEDSEMQIQTEDGEGDNYDSDKSELILQDREAEGWDDAETDDSDDGSYGGDDSDDMDNSDHDH